MRKITLWNKITFESIELWTGSILATDITGFGSKLNVKMSNKKVVAVDREFENITLNIYFGVNGNAYEDYTDLMEFFGESGHENIVLEYNSGEGSMYCDVMLLNAPKTQKNQYRVLNEVFVFQRLTPWYVVESINLLLPGAFPKLVTIENNTLSNIEVVIIFEVESQEPGGDVGDIVIIRETTLGGELGRIVFENDTDRSLIVIDSELKEVTRKDIDTDLIENAYDKLNHEYESFIVIEPGTTVLKVSDPDPLHLNIYALVYKKWLVV